jgi:hypothetical protein
MKRTQEKLLPMMNYMIRGGEKVMKYKTLIKKNCLLILLTITDLFFSLVIISALILIVYAIYLTKNSNLQLYNYIMLFAFLLLYHGKNKIISELYQVIK